MLNLSVGNYVKLSKKIVIALKASAAYKLFSALVAPGPLVAQKGPLSICISI